MLPGTQLKYGPINGVDHPRYPVGLDATQTFDPRGGAFVTINTGNGYAALSINSSVVVYGYADVGALNNDNSIPFVSSGTAGNDLADVILGSDVVFRIPVLSGTFAATTVGLAIDVDKGTCNGIANCQGATVGTTTRKLVIVVGGDLLNNAWVDCIMSPAKRST